MEVGSNQTIFSNSVTILISEKSFNLSKEELKQQEDLGTHLIIYSENTLISTRGNCQDKPK